MRSHPARSATPDHVVYRKQGGGSAPLIEREGDAQCAKPKKKWPLLLLAYDAKISISSSVLPSFLPAHSI